MKPISQLALLASTATLGSALLFATPASAASVPANTVTMEATAYGPSAQDNYPYGPTDYFGRPLATGDIAVDPNVIPLGTCVRITGYQSPNFPSGGFVGEADDEGNGVQGNHVDLFLNAPQAQVNQFGIQHVQVTVLGAAAPNATGSAACTAYR